MFPGIVPPGPGPPGEYPIPDCIGLLTECFLDTGVAFGGRALGAVRIGVSYICPGRPGGAIKGGGPTQQNTEYEEVCNSTLAYLSQKK